MEKLIYEARPFALIALSVLALWRNNGSTLMQGSAILLLALSIYVLHLRLSHRNYYDYARERYTRR